MRPTATPENSAAVSLPPIEKICRPHWKRVISSWNTIASTIMTSGATQSAGSPSGRQPPTSLLETSKYRPSVMMKASPRVMPITPSVAMNGGSLTRTMSAELSAPAPIPTSSAHSMDGARAQPASTNRYAQTTLASAMIDPGARSMPPEMMTTAAPTAAMP